MNPAMLGMMAQRLGLGAEEQAALASGDTSRFLSARMASDPKFGSDPMVAQLMASMQGQGNAVPTESAEEDAGSERLQAALDTLLYLAQVLGACACFGQDSGCARCRGHGVPGFDRSTDPQRLVAWARSALRPFGLRITRAEQLPSKQSNHT